MTIRNATVLGAGVMGSQIAALLVNAGLRVKLLDVAIDPQDKNKLAKVGYDRIVDPKKGMLYDPSFAANLNYGNFDDDLSQPSDADIFIEAVKEDIKIKHEVWSKVAGVAKASAILATNTSGIPINMIAKVFDEATRQRFIGLHFFNPPRFMKLIELIPNKSSSPELVAEVKVFAEDVLGKGVVVANDVPAFVANRTGVHAMGEIMSRAEQAGLSVAEVDALTGKAIGRPMGTYTLSDLVGNDIALFVSQGLRQDPSEAKFFHPVKSLSAMVEKGLLGNKAKAGFYKREGRNKYVLNLETMEYQPLEKVQLPLLAKFTKNVKDNLDLIFTEQDSAAKFLWESLRETFAYAAQNVPKASEDYKAIDQAMVWGFNWQYGPFQLWDLMGFDRVKERMQEEGVALPDWVKERNTPFYADTKADTSVSSDQIAIEEILWDRPGQSSLKVTQDQQLIFMIQTANNTINDELSQAIVEAVDCLEEGPYSLMVISSKGPHFSLGANLKMVRETIEANQIQEVIDTTVKELHQAVNRIRYASKPIVTAAQGRALGGGCELLLASPYVVAAAESYIGLVEVGVGLIPAGGGLAEITERIMTQPGLEANKIKLLADAVSNIAQAKVYMNAYEAKRNFILRESDLIINNGDKRVPVALAYAKLLAESNYIPRSRQNFVGLGEDFEAVVEAQLDAMRVGGFISDYDMEVCLALAHVVAGGDIPRGALINQAWLQDLEREAFVRLVHNQKTYERITHMLETRKPLRN